MQPDKIGQEREPTIPLLLDFEDLPLITGRRWSLAARATCGSKALIGAEKRHFHTAILCIGSASATIVHRLGIT